MAATKGLTEAALRDLLDKDSANGLPAVRENKINRNHYARILGCSRGAMTRFGNVFSEYESKFEIATGPTRELEAMRLWLTAAYESKQLAFDGHKIQRKAFAKQFELRGGTVLGRHPAINKLFVDLEARAKAEDYKSAAHEATLQAVRLALTGTPALNTDRLTINREALAAQLNVSSSKLKERHASALIEQKEAEIKKAAQESKVDPYFNNRVYQFSTLSEKWPISFLQRLGSQFKLTHAGRPASFTKTSHFNLLRLFDHIGHANTPYCTQILLECQSKTTIKNAKDWEEALHEYRQSLFLRLGNQELVAISVDSAIGALRSSLSMLAANGVVPETSVPIPGIRMYRHLRRHLASVAEATPKQKSSDKQEYLDFAKDRLKDACRQFPNVTEDTDAELFLESLASEIHASTSLPDDPTTAIRQIIEQRLNALRDAAESRVTVAAEAFERGRELLSMAKIDGNRFEAEYFGSPMNKAARGAIMRPLFRDALSGSEEEAEQGLANLLGLIDQCHGGVPPPGDSKGTKHEGQFFAKRYRAYGGLANIMPMLHPSPDAAASVLTLYLVESGANVSVGRTLDQDCIESSDLDNHQRITGNKARAKGKPIIVDLPETCPAVRGIKWLAAASLRLRPFAGEDTDMLFLARKGPCVRLIPANWYTQWFKAFVSTIPELSRLELTPNMIRPSVLLHVALSNDGRLAAGMAVGQHGGEVSQGYQVKFPTRLLYDQNIRRFQASFQTLVMSAVEGAAEKLGVSKAQFEAQLNELRPTGLGTFCRGQPTARIQEEGRCKTLDCWNDCPNLLVVAEVRAIVSLQIWRSSLRACRAAWERDRPERWDQVWLPWLCFTEVVSEKMSRGPLLKIWKEAERLVVDAINRPNFVPPKPW
jgi:hypothetical protein